MAYRRETDGLRMRVADLEAELSEANDKVARVTGAASPPTEGSRTEQSVLLGAPSRVVLERVVDFEVPERGLEHVAKVLEARLPRGKYPRQVAQVGHTLRAPGFSMESRDGRTRVRMEGDYRAASGVAVSLCLLGGVFLAVLAFALAQAVFFHSISRTHFVWLIPLAILAVFPIVRTILAGDARKQDARVRGTFETVLEVAREAALGERPELARIALDRPEGTTHQAADVEPAPEDGEIAEAAEASARGRTSR